VDGGNFYVTPAMMSILGATHEDMETILKGLGYKGEPRLESDVKPTSPADNTSDAQPKTSKSDPVDSPAPEAPDGMPEAEKVEASEEPTAQTPETETEEPQEPAKILVWRYGGNRSAQKPKYKPSKKSNAKGKRKEHKSGGGNSDRHNNKRNKRNENKEPDPNSPFAALAALKENMKSGNE